MFALDSEKLRYVYCNHKKNYQQDRVKNKVDKLKEA